MSQTPNPPSIYLADTLFLRFPTTAAALQRAFVAAGATVGLLPGTRDIWARDYMPVPTPGGLTQFCYAPDYLRPDVKRTITNGGLVASALGLPFRRNSLLVDGGNVVSGFGRIIMTDKVFQKNPALTRAQVRAELERVLQADRIDFVPADPDDFTGHADGLVHFLDERTVLANNCSATPTKREQQYARRFEAALTQAGLATVRLPCNPFDNKHINGKHDYDSAVGIYLNFVDVGTALIVPVYEKEEDEPALKLLQSLYPGKQIVPVNGIEVAKEGGVFHCVTWDCSLPCSVPASFSAS